MANSIRSIRRCRRSYANAAELARAPMDTDELEMKLREKAEYLDFYCDQWWGGQVAYYKDEERVVIFQRNGRTLKELLQNLVKEVFDA